MVRYSRRASLGLRVLLPVLAASLLSGAASAQSFEQDLAPLLEASCLACHGDRTVTALNLARLGFDLTDSATFRAWERIYERVERGEMPPPAAARPRGAGRRTGARSAEARAGQRESRGPRRRARSAASTHAPRVCVHHPGSAAGRRRDRCAPGRRAAGGSRLRGVRHGGGQPEHVAAACAGLSRGGRPGPRRGHRARTTTANHATHHRVREFAALSPSLPTGRCWAPAS